jgi:hypothetical protein
VSHRTSGYASNCIARLILKSERTRPAQAFLQYGFGADHLDVGEFRGRGCLSKLRISNCANNGPPSDASRLILKTLALNTNSNCEHHKIESRAANKKIITGLPSDASHLILKTLERTSRSGQSVRERQTVCKCHIRTCSDAHPSASCKALDRLVERD